MKASKVLFSIVLLLNLSTLSAQNTKVLPRTTFLIESGEGNNKKSCLGYFYSFELTTDNVFYSSILATKAVVNNSSEIKLFFKTKENEIISNKGPYILYTIKADDIIQDNDPNNDTVAIPFGEIRQLMLEKGIFIDPVFLTEEYLRETLTLIKGNDLNKLKTIWNKKNGN